jgi:molybdate transport system substrate-binding protein
MAEISIYSGGAPKEALAVLTPQFEQRTGHRITYRYAVIAELQQRLATGETPDMVIMPVPALDALLKAGVLKRTALAVFGGVGIGVIVRQGAPHPDISAPEQFKAALLSARSVVHAHPNATPSGAHLAKVERELGIESELQGKLIYSNALDGGVERITKGEADIGIYPVSEVIAVKGVALVGLLPPALQSLIIYGAGVLAKSAVAEPAEAFIAFLTDPAHQPIWTKAGFDPLP